MKRILLCLVICWCFAMTDSAPAATPTVAQALTLTPVQKGVDYDRPTAEEAEKCTIEARRLDGHAGWIVQSPTGMLLREFIDTNGDNRVHRWSYYKDGLEVYRDIDADHNGKADQYRWFNTAGSRWGLDENEDGSIDQWKAISAEEVTAEAVAALATQDAARFNRLVLQPSEIKSLGLGQSKSEALAKKISTLGSEFAKVAQQQNGVTGASKWIQFSATRPGVVPAGTEGSTKDLWVYENVMAIVQTGGSHGQVHIGTLVQIGNAWRAIDVPQPISGEKGELSVSGFFFQPAALSRARLNAEGPSENAQESLAALDEIDRAASHTTKPEELAKLNARRANLLEQVAEQANTQEERTMWLRQLTDMLSGAVQEQTYPDGIKRLEALFEKLSKNAKDKDLAAHAKFRLITTEYAQSLQNPKADYAKIQTDLLKKLEEYVGQYPSGPDTAEAMLQLAMNKEFVGEEGEAAKWYGRIAKEYPGAAAAKKAAGAQTRLESVGKNITLRGTSSTGHTVDIEQLRGKPVLVQYWATWSAPSKADMVIIKEMYKKYGKPGFGVIGVNLDARRKDLADFLAENPLPWPQIFEEGGLDSRLANEMGIVTVPTMILIDAKGKVVQRSIQASELDAQLEKLLR